MELICYTSISTHQDMSEQRIAFKGASFGMLIAISCFGPKALVFVRNVNIPET